MAPELLERLVNLMDIELFKRVDVYALALVYWEMANRCEAEQGKVELKSIRLIRYFFALKLCWQRKIAKLVYGSELFKFCLDQFYFNYQKMPVLRLYCDTFLEYEDQM